MKALIIGNKERYEKFFPKNQFSMSVEKIYCDINTPLNSISESVKDADFIAVDAIGKVPGQLILQMPKLKIIHSEGVGYNKIDIDTAAKRGIYVCNNKGVNANAVAEQTILLMLGLLRDVIAGDMEVRNGNQIKTKERMMLQGITELKDCTIGLIGFGDIAKATEHMVDEKFLRGMRPDAFLVNTARGEIVDNAALCRALKEKWIAGAGLDTVEPEPVKADNILLQLPEEIQSKIIFSPHIGGVTTTMFRTAHQNIWRAFEAVSKNERPDNVVNKL